MAYFKLDVTIISNNIAITDFKSFVKDDQYEGMVILQDSSAVDRQFINHITGGIVVNTTTQDNIVVGHIDSDISCDKIEESNGVSGGQYMPNNK